MQIIKGGFALNPSDERILNQQRSITSRINNDFIQVGATFLRMSSKNPTESDWYKHKFRDTNLQQWVDNPDYRPLNLGFNLQFGWLDIDIDAPDERYNRSILAAFKCLGVDTRFAFGRASKGVASHLLVQLAEADMNNYDTLKDFEPKEFAIGGKRFKTELRSMGPLTENANAIKQAKQTVMPGSVYADKNNPNQPDISVWYSDNGKVANQVDDIAQTTPHKVNFHPLITGIAFGTFLYVLQPHWVEGTRQVLASKVVGFLARLVLESIGVNRNEGISRGTFCPIDTPEVAEGMIEFLCKETGDDEAYMRKRIFRDSLKKLENNPDAKIPGWPSMEGELGAESMLALRTVFMPGVDVSPLTDMANNYLYDDATDKYLDRERFDIGLGFVFDGGELERRHRNDFIEVGGKQKSIFKVFEASPLRRRVRARDLYPDLSPGIIFRLYKGEVIPDDQDEPKSATYFNTWRGWPYEPAENPDAAILDRCSSMLDRLFGYLTQDNFAQVQWLKEWIAWTVQFPGQKQQIAPVFMGGQGVGKSFFGNIFLNSIFGSLWGSANPKILDGQFSVEPFIGKMFVFVDEAKFHSEASTDEIKKIIRNVDISGAEKFQSAQNHRIFARAVFASNRMDMNIAQQNVQDRALFYMRAYDAEHIRQNQRGYLTWTESLKPFFTEFNALLTNRSVKEHFMYLFKTMPVDRNRLESTKYSSSDDPQIVSSNMTYSRRVAKALIEEGRVWEEYDISAPFPMAEFEKRVSEITMSMGLRGVVVSRVFSEFEAADLITRVVISNQRMFKFKYKIATLHDKFGEAINMLIDPRYLFTEEDRGENNITDFKDSKPWKGINPRFRNI